MKVLFICRYFPPENKIGAVRPSRIARYLHKNNGVDVDVLTVEPLEGFDTNVQQDNYGTHIFRVKPPLLILKLNHIFKRPNSNLASSEINKKSTHSKTSKQKSIKRIIRNGLFHVREFVLEKSYIYRARRKLGHLNGKYDVLVSTYSTKFSHILAMTYKEQNPEVKWIADYRDALWGADSTERQKKQGSKFVKKISKKCDAITIVSEGIKEIHSMDFGKVPVHVIPNGYDREDLIAVSSEKTKHKKTLQIVYTGELYNGKRDLTPLFRAITHLCSDNSITSNDIEVIYAGKSGDVFVNQIRQYPEVHYQLKGFLPRNDALFLQANADILLMASWCEPNEKSIMTGKFFEYLQMDKPIICLISGSASGCELSDIIQKHNLGCSHEMATDDEDFQMLCDYVKECVSEKKGKGRISYQADKEFIIQYDYQNIASKFYEIIRGLLYLDDSC